MNTATLIALARMSPAQIRQVVSQLSTAQRRDLLIAAQRAKSQGLGGLSGLGSIFDTIIGIVGGVGTLIPGIGTVIQPILNRINPPAPQIQPISQPTPPTYGPPAQSANNTPLLIGAGILALALLSR